MPDVITGDWIKQQRYGSCSDVVEFADMLDRVFPEGLQPTIEHMERAACTSLQDGVEHLVYGLFDWDTIEKYQRWQSKWLNCGFAEDRRRQKLLLEMLHYDALEAWEVLHLCYKFDVDMVDWYAPTWLAFMEFWKYELGEE